MTRSPRRIPAALRSDLERMAVFRTQLRRYLHKTRTVTRAAGLTPERYDLLLMVEAAGDEPEAATVSRLCERLDLKQTAVTELVKRAVEAGLLTRQRSARDGRVFLLGLTEEGERRLCEVFDALAADRVQFVEAFKLLHDRFHA